VWEDGGLGWAWQPHSGHLMLSFPRSIDPAAAARGVEFARGHDALVVGAWLSTGTAARAAGAKRAVLNSTPDGEPCYASEGL
jgi:hypothetical protein